MRVRIFKKIILLILMLAVICVKENVYAYAADNKQGVDVILMIDTSVSMGNGFSPRPSIALKAQAALSLASPPTSRYSRATPSETTLRSTTVNISKNSNNATFLLESFPELFNEI